MQLDQTLWVFLSNLYDGIKTDNHLSVFKRSVICFMNSENQYPQQTLSALVRTIKKRHQVTFLDITTIELSALRAMLAISFLGNSAIYWLGDISVLSEKKSQELIAYVASYVGPHTLLCYCSQKNIEVMRANTQIITCEPVTTVEQLAVLATLGAMSAGRSIENFSRLLMRKNRTILLENAFLLTRYATVIGRNSEQFINEWLDQLMPSQESLFILSKSFFARDTRNFYAQLAILELSYGPPFWTMYWSEQFFRAYWFVKLKSTGATASVLGSVSQRLPFSFIERDWRTISCTQLKELQSLIYAIDWEIKNGGSAVLLERLYARHFANK